MSPKTQDQYKKYLLHNYASPPLSLVSGQGCRVTDDQGEEYLDFTSGIAVNSLGHSHPSWAAAISKQLETLGHCSNLYAVPGQGELAERLSHYTPQGRFLFCNSGAEANEALLKLARLHGCALTGREGERYVVVTADNAFHGRTFGGMAATPQEKIQKGFRPMLPGFRHARMNDISAFQAAIEPGDVAAVILETIQGEGGIFVTEPAFLRELRDLCARHDVLLMMDEVQCGIGRSGDFFAYEESGIEPDAIGMAKGLAGGFPMGAIWVREDKASLFTPGSHGTTFGGNPMACAAALSVLNVIEKEDLLTRVKEQSEWWLPELHQLKESSNGAIRQIRGKGYLLGLEMAEDHLDWVARLRKERLLVAPAGHQTVRLIPPLTASMKDLEQCTEILRRVILS